MHTFIIHTITAFHRDEELQPIFYSKLRRKSLTYQGKQGGYCWDSILMRWRFGAKGTSSLLPFFFSAVFL